MCLREGALLEWRDLSRAAKHARLEQAFAQPEAVALLLRVSRADLIAFRTHLKEVGLSTLAVNRCLAGIGSILRELHLHGYRPDDPAERLRTLRTEREYSATRGRAAEPRRRRL